MAHRSWVSENPGQPSNERLEFLGDAVLGWVVADIAFRQFTELPEGALTDLRKSVVNATALAEVAEELGIGPALLLGKGEDAAGGREKPSILSDALEAVLGAVYVDGGTAVAYALIERLVGPRLAAAVDRLDQLDHKSSLQEAAARSGFGAPEYVVRAEGPGPRQEVLRNGRARRSHHRRGRGPLEEGSRADGSFRSVRPARRRLTVRPASSVPQRRMPELPEVETVRRGLDRLVVGRRVEAVEIGRLRTVRRTSAQAVVDGLTGATIVAANRRGKYLLIPLDTGDEMMIHLRMTGKLLVATDGAPRPPHTHVVMHLDDGNELWFVDPRTFGEVVVFDPTNVAVELPELALLGIDPVADGLTLQQLRQLLRSRNRGAQAAAPRPAPDRRHRQHLRRRDPAHRPAAPRPDVELARPQIGGDAARCDPRRARGGDRVRRFDVARLAVRRLVRRRRHVPGGSSRVRPRRRPVFHVWAGMGAAGRDRSAFDPFLPDLPALRAGTTVPAQGTGVNWIE